MIDEISENLKQRNGGFKPPNIPVNNEIDFGNPFHSPSSDERSPRDQGFNHRFPPQGATP